MLVLAHTGTSFLPETLGAWCAVFAAVASSCATVASLRNRSKIEAVHVLVNGNLDLVQKQLKEITGERDTLLLHNRRKEDEKRGDA